jgi:hypothetical protein
MECRKEEKCGFDCSITISDSVNGPAWLPEAQVNEKLHGELMELSAIPDLSPLATIFSQNPL